MIENSPGNRFQVSLFYSNRSNLATKMKPGHNTVKLKKAVVLFRYLNFQKKNPNTGFMSYLPVQVKLYSENSFNQNGILG